ncbi:MAG: Crp/Fnr family transcriptional regulator [Firmicutes bacterium]|nr:Crp/Fnr family transcriptional regulator [Bacillota bacterium]
MNQVVSDDIERLRKVGFLSALESFELDRVASVIAHARFRKNRVIFAEGEPGDALFFVRSGRVKLFNTGPDGREHVVNILKGGDVFAGVVFFDRGPYPATAEVIEDAELGIIRSEDFDKVMKAHPAIPFKIMKVLSERLGRAEQQIAEMALKDACSRLASRLVELALVHGRRTLSGIVLDAAVTREELAALAGTSRETVSRVLGTFKRTGALEIGRGTINVRDLEKLRGWV